MSDGTEKLDNPLTAALERLREVAVRDDAVIAQQAQERRADERRQALRSSGILVVLKDDDRRRLLRDELFPTKALTSTRDWLTKAVRPVEPGPNALVLCGGTGCGKTVAAGWAIGVETGRYMTIFELMRAYERYIRSRAREGTVEAEMRTLRRAHLVVLDELGQERGSDAELAREALHWLIDVRQSRRRQLTMVLANLEAPEFVARLRSGVYDPRTADRLRAMARVVSISEESLRRTTASSEPEPST